MPTNDERRDVARKLRAIDYDALKESLICAFLDAIGETGYLDWVGVAHRLADLIEPEPERTCRMTKIGGDKVLAGWWKCSECGPVYPPCKDEIAKWALQKCPRCGAKVVSE